MYHIEKSIKNIINYSFLPDTSNIIHIGYGIDNNYVRCCSTSIVSLQNNPQENFHFYIMISNLDEISKTNFIYWQNKIP